MGISSSSNEAKIQHSQSDGIGRKVHERGPYATMVAELLAARAREEALLREKSDLLRHQDTLALEFEHRVMNSLQMLSSLLTLQCRSAPTTEAAAQLTIAAHRVSAVGRVHGRLHLLDHQDSVEFSQYLRDLCKDLAALLFPDPAGRSIIVQSSNFEIPAVLGIPLGLIVSELITNATKYTTGNITVRIVTTTPGSHSLSVLDDGPGLPAAFDPEESKGLGMKIILLLVKQIGGELHVLPGGYGCGARFTVTFRSGEAATSQAHSNRA
jgi:two-component system, sensor histidine kinase PdtaS